MCSLPSSRFQSLNNFGICAFYRIKGAGKQEILERQEIQKLDRKNSICLETEEKFWVLLAVLIINNMGENNEITTFG